MNYTIIENENGKGILCHTCNLTSWNPMDVEQHYCGCCHVFHDDEAAKEEMTKRAEAMKDPRSLWP